MIAKHDNLSSFSSHTVSKTSPVIMYSGKKVFLSSKKDTPPTTTHNSRKHKTLLAEFFTSKAPPNIRSPLSDPDKLKIIHLIHAAQRGELGQGRALFEIESLILQGGGRS